MADSDVVIFNVIQFYNWTFLATGTLAIEINLTNY